jgi:soluble lytic murein transglycosylase-like protein
VRRAALPLPEAWQRTVARLSCALGVAREVRIGESPDVAVPTVVGWLRPVILLPLSLVSTLPPSTVEAVLLHELAHVRRHDYLVNALQQALAALLFYHPCVHWVSRVAREEREHCCDDLAVSVTGDPVFYARALASVEAARAEPFPLGVASNGGSLMQRIERLLGTPSVPARARASWPAPALAAAVLVALAVLPVAACSDAARTDASGKTTMAQTAALIPQSVTRWMPELSQAGARWGVDPDLLAAITLIESRGDPDAVSPAGSVGLMQIMPATGAKIAEERGMHDYAPSRLRDPAYNADFGAFYLARQLHDFGSVELAAAAYNAGPKAVRAYLDEGKPLPEETRQYESRVATLWSQLHAAKQTN